MAKIALALAIITVTLTTCLYQAVHTERLVVASAENARWCRVNTPAEGSRGNWSLASGSEVKCLAEGPDGRLYAHAAGLSNTLYASSDGGYAWSAIGRVTDDIVALTTVPEEAARIYYATTSTVYRSTDGGSTFQALPQAPGGADSGSVVISSLVVSQDGEGFKVVVGPGTLTPGNSAGFTSSASMIPSHSGKIPLSAATIFTLPSYPLTTPVPGRWWP